MHASARGEGVGGQVPVSSSALVWCRFCLDHAHGENISERLSDFGLIIIFSNAERSAKIAASQPDGSLSALCVFSSPAGVKKTGFASRRLEIVARAQSCVIAFSLLPAHS